MKTIKPNYTKTRLKIIKKIKSPPGYRVICKCVCGNIWEGIYSNYKNKVVRSCGCLKIDSLKYRKFIHGKTGTPEHNAWTNMLGRCRRREMKRWYKNIKVCKKWQKSFDNFLKDVGHRPSPKHTLDRIDNNKGYFPSNVRWATRDVQSQNTRNHCTNKSGVRGVSLCKDGKTWRAHISYKNKSIHLGHFCTLKDAEKARLKAEKKYWKNK